MTCRGWYSRKIWMNSGNQNLFLTHRFLRTSSKCWLRCFKSVEDGSPAKHWSALSVKQWIGCTMER